MKAGGQCKWLWSVTVFVCCWAASLASDDPRPDVAHGPDDAAGGSGNNTALDDWLSDWHGWRIYEGGLVELSPLRLYPARLDSRLFAETLPRCLAYQVWLTDAVNCQLSVTLHEGRTATPLWNSSVHDSAGVWHSVAVNLTAEEPFRLRITGEKVGWNDEVWLHDIQLLTSPCPTNVTMLFAATHTPPPRNVTTTTSSSDLTSATPISTTTTFSTTTTSATTTTTSTHMSLSSSMSTSPSTTTQDSGADVMSGVLGWGNWTNIGWTENEKSGVRQVQTLRTWPATLTSGTLTSISTGTLLCLRFQWLATSPDNLLNVTLEEMGGEGGEGGGGGRSSTELWDSGNEDVWRDAWHSQNLQFEAPPTYRVRITGWKQFWNDDIAIRGLQLLPAPCPPQPPSTPSPTSNASSTITPLSHRPSSAASPPQTVPTLSPSVSGETSTTGTSATSNTSSTQGVQTSATYTSSAPSSTGTSDTSNTSSTQGVQTSATYTSSAPSSTGTSDTSAAPPEETVTPVQLRPSQPGPTSRVTRVQPRPSQPGPTSTVTPVQPIPSQPGPTSTVTPVQPRPSQPGPTSTAGDTPQSASRAGPQPSTNTPTTREAVTVTSPTPESPRSTFVLSTSHTSPSLSAAAAAAAAAAASSTTGPTVFGGPFGMTVTQSPEPTSATIVGALFATLVIVVVVVLVVVFVYRRGYYIVCLRYLRFHDDQEALEVSFHNKPVRTPGGHHSGSPPNLTWTQSSRSRDTNPTLQIRARGYHNADRVTSPRQAQAKNDNPSEVGAASYTVASPYFHAPFSTSGNENVGEVQSPTVVRFDRAQPGSQPETAQGAVTQSDWTSFSEA